jgi:FrmR/RcnR family transcriptional regulator, repressor of frmRAB operon
VPARRRVENLHFCPNFCLTIYIIGGYAIAMSHTIRQKTKLAQRVARIRGQIDAVARALDAEVECGEVLRLVASARGAMNSLMAEILEDHVRVHAFPNAKPHSEEAQAAEDLVDIIRSYLK